jgi:hypothetical protein
MLLMAISVWKSSGEDSLEIEGSVVGFSLENGIFAMA